MKLACFDFITWDNIHDNRHWTGSWLFSDLEFGQYVFHLIKTINMFILF